MKISCAKKIVRKNDQFSIKSNQIKIVILLSKNNG